MRQLCYAMQFRGRGEPAGENVFRASTESPSTRITSVVGDRGLESQFESIDGNRAEFTSEVRLTGDTAFTETGTIRFGEGHSLEFSTIGEGFMGPSPDDGLNHGSIMWRVDRGEGMFSGAMGIITSNFTFGADGEVIDNQFGLIWVE